MAVTTYNELYSLMKENEVYIRYNKTSSSEGEDLGQMGLRMTLVRDKIKESDDSLRVYDVSTLIGEWALSGDSDGALDSRARSSINAATMTYPDYIKAYSTNYAEWLNIKISDIVSVQTIVEE